ncbi:MAG TPA: hypothetical protein VGC55_06870, partial [Dokdonella sp.]
MRLLHFGLACSIACLLPSIPAFADAHSALSASPEDARFTKLADEYFDTLYFPLNPTSATSAGVHTYDARLEDYSRAGIDRQIAALQGFEKRIGAVDAKTLGEQVRGDRDLLLN